MFGTSDNQNNQQNQTDDQAQAAGPRNDYGTMPPIENTPFGAPAPQPAAVTTEPPSTAPVTTPVAEDLLTIKQDALQHLSPLVGHLEQSPEEKFRTTMMMIQAADDQNLVKDAFEAAKQISDDKARAQALLDVINEINYFTQHQQ